MKETFIEIYLVGVSVLVAIRVSQDGCREIIGATEGMKEERESFRSFFVWLKERGFTDVRLIIGDKNFGVMESIPEVFPKNMRNICFRTWRYGQSDEYCGYTKRRSDVIDYSSYQL